MAEENKLILLMEYSTVPEISSQLGVKKKKKDKPSLKKKISNFKWHTLM